LLSLFPLYEFVRLCVCLCVCVCVFFSLFPCNFFYHSSFSDFYHVHMFCNRKKQQLLPRLSSILFLLWQLVLLLTPSPLLAGLFFFFFCRVQLDFVCDVTFLFFFANKVKRSFHPFFLFCGEACEKQNPSLGVFPVVYTRFCMTICLLLRVRFPSWGSMNLRICGYAFIEQY
jgi:hypothetical protein